MRALFGFLVFAFCAAAALPSSAGDAAKGKGLFARCGVCHTVEKNGPNRVGPNLFGVVGRTAGSVAGYAYSPAMKKGGIVWNGKTLDAFLASPSHAVPGTKMPFAGITDAHERADLVAYLATLK